MNAILTVLGTFFKKIFSKDALPYTFFVMILILSALWLSTCSRLNTEKTQHENDINRYKNNIVAMTDSLSTNYNKKLQQEVTSKTSYIVSTVDELKQYNAKLYNEMNSMKGNIADINSQLEIIGNIGSTNNTLTKIDSTLYGLNWKWNYEDSGFKQNLIGISKFRFIKGNLFPDKTTIDTNNMNISLSYGFQDLGDKYKVWATSPSKLIKFTELNGALIIDKDKTNVKKINRFCIGPSIGFGVNTDIKGSLLRFGWNIGITATYNLLGKK